MPSLGEAVLLTRQQSQANPGNNGHVRGRTDDFVGMVASMLLEPLPTLETLILMGAPLQFWCRAPLSIAMAVSAESLGQSIRLLLVYRLVWLDSQMLEVFQLRFFQMLD